MNTTTVTQVPRTLLTGFILLLTSCTHEAIDPPAEFSELFFPRVRTIVQNRCTSSCHAPTAGLPNGLPVSLETVTSIVYYSQSIKAAVADPSTQFNHHMPPDDTLSTEEIDIIVQWAALGGLSTIAPPH